MQDIIDCTYVSGDRKSYLLEVGVKPGSLDIKAKHSTTWLKRLLLMHIPITPINSLALSRFISESAWGHAVNPGHFHIDTVKSVLSGHSKIDKTKVLKTNGSLMKVESIAECSLGAFCNTFDLH